MIGPIMASTQAICHLSLHKTWSSSCRQLHAKVWHNSLGNVKTATTAPDHYASKSSRSCWKPFHTFRHWHQHNDRDSSNNVVVCELRGFLKKSHFRSVAKCWTHVFWSLENRKHHYHFTKKMMKVSSQVEYLLKFSHLLQYPDQYQEFVEIGI